MPITDTDAAAYVDRALGGSPTGRTSIALANDAGRTLMSMRPWRWADGTETLLDLVASQSYVWLPTDFRDLKAAQLVGEVATQLYPTGHEELLNMRARDVVPADTPAFYVVTYAPNSGDSDRLNPRLELHPTPTQNATDGLRVWYTKGWSAFPSVADGTEALIPDWMEPLYLAVLSAMARGWEDDLHTPNAQGLYLSQLKATDIYLAAVKQDGEMQPSLGPPSSGFGSEARRWGPYVPPVQL